MTGPLVYIADKDGSDHRITIPIPNGFMRAALKAVEEITGRRAENAMLRFAGLEHAVERLPPDNLEFDEGYVFRDYANLNHAIIQFYGRAGKVHAMRIGHSSARWMIENHPLFGFAGVSFEVMPPTQAIRLGLNNTAEGFRKLYRLVHFDIHITVQEEDDHFIWSSPDCPCCVGKAASAPICWIWEAGFIEGGSIVTGGMVLDVIQTACTACGDAECTWIIKKPPTGN